MNRVAPRQPGEIRAGDVFTRLTATAETMRREHDGRKMRWCVCTCGEQLWVNETSLKAENSQSCGCLRKDKARAQSLKAREAFQAAGGSMRGSDGKFLPKYNGVTTTKGLS